jgi:hypothetical protein
MCSRTFCPSAPTLAAKRRGSIEGKSLSEGRNEIRPVNHQGALVYQCMICILEPFHLSRVQTNLAPPYVSALGAQMNLSASTYLYPITTGHSSPGPGPPQGRIQSPGIEPRRAPTSASLNPAARCGIAAVIAAGISDCPTPVTVLASSAKARNSDQGCFCGCGSMPCGQSRERER